MQDMGIAVALQQLAERCTGDAILIGTVHHDLVLFVERLQRFLRVYGSGRRTTALAAALEAGFGSYAQFYRVFREETGRNPATLRTSDRVG